MIITLVTGNLDKLKELQAVFPSQITFRHAKLDLPEIQGEHGDPTEILKDKLERAYEAVGSPVIVEDVSAELDCLNGLPGPFVKFFEQRLGVQALWVLAQHTETRSATIRCTMGFFDGSIQKIVAGTVRGTIVPPRGGNGFGFDFVFMPDGHQRTTAEMSAEEKNSISWRSRAARTLAEQITPILADLD